MRFQLVSVLGIQSCYISHYIRYFLLHMLAKHGEGVDEDIPEPAGLCWLKGNRARTKTPFPPFAEDAAATAD